MHTDLVIMHASHSLEASDSTTTVAPPGTNIKAPTCILTVEHAFRL